MRKKFRWDVKLGAATGDTVTERVEAFWDPDHETTTDAVAVASVVQAWLRAGRPTEKASQSFHAMSVALVPAGA